MKMTVIEKTLVVEDTLRVRLAPQNEKALPPFSPGAHIEIAIGAIKRRYSLTSSPTARQFFEICVLKTVPSRGGSKYIHEDLCVGETLEVQGPFSAFDLKMTAPHTVLIAGGIGITPFLTMMEALAEAGRSFEVHYASRNSARLLPLAPFEQYVTQYVDDGGSPTLDVARMISQCRRDAHFYVCGPQPLIEAVRSTVAALNLPAEALHIESFGALSRSADQPFTLRLLQSQLTIPVKPGVSILDAMTEAGVWAPSECRRGECGSCYTPVLSGAVDHRDVCLSPDQRRAGMCTCVSWPTSDELTLDL
jgi:vanillate O-demethylase ferredoxin subunit